MDARAKKTVTQFEQECRRRDVDVSEYRMELTAKLPNGKIAIAFPIKLKKARMRDFEQDCRNYGADVSDCKMELNARLPNGEYIGVGPFSIQGMGCKECSCQYCECDGTCDPDYATSCHMCDTWICGYCVVEGACHNCFSKMQGGVN